MENGTTKVVAAIALAVVMFGAGYLFGNHEEEAKAIMTDTVDTANNAVSDTISEMNNDDTTDTPSVENPDTVAFTINASNLSDGQRSMLRSMGIDDTEIQVTNSMLACAETKIGSSRMQEIQNGATPSFTEGVKLLACYE